VWAALSGAAGVGRGDNVRLSAVAFVSKTGFQAVSGLLVVGDSKLF